MGAAGKQVEMLLRQVLLGVLDVSRLGERLLVFRNQS